LVLLETEYGKDVCFLVGEDNNYLYLVDKFSTVKDHSTIQRRMVHRSVVKRCVDLFPGRALLEIEDLLKEEFNWRGGRHESAI